MFEIDDAIAQRQVQQKFQKAVQEMNAAEFVLETQKKWFRIYLHLRYYYMHNIHPRHLLKLI